LKEGGLVFHAAGATTRRHSAPPNSGENQGKVKMSGKWATPNNEVDTSANSFGPDLI